MGGLLGFVIALILMGLLFYAFIWFLDWIALPEPFNKIIKVVVGLFFLIYLLGALTGQVPGPNHFLQGNWR